MAEKNIFLQLNKTKFLERITHFCLSNVAERSLTKLENQAKIPIVYNNTNSLMFTLSILLYIFYSILPTRHLQVLTAKHVAGIYEIFSNIEYKNQVLFLNHIYFVDLLPQKLKPIDVKRSCQVNIKKNDYVQTFKM